ncbi:MAG TPA: glutathione synthase [Steroidobacteraceae bacterium]|nr:glutathione synthase [Steroidobacteraceae bacterium]
MPARPSLAVLMDPLDAIKPAKDSTVAMLAAAARRGCETWCFTQADLSVRDGRAIARLTPIEVAGKDKDKDKDWYRIGAPVVRPLAGLGAVLMRKDPPFDMEYIYATYLLERAEAEGVLVVNRPQGLRDMNEKVYTAWFPDCCAPTLITRDMDAMGAFLEEHGRIVCKPLEGMGGRSIFVVATGDKNARVVFETLTAYGTRYAMVQRYLPEIAESGDARILLVDGEPVPHALARIPGPADHRGNLAAGARGVGRGLTDRERWIAARIGPVMRERGMLFVGLDVIGGFVTEINVTSPTGIRELEAQFGGDIAGSLIDAVLARLHRP